MKEPPTINDMQGFAVRHTRIVDRDKVRYRVYKNSTEYVAVIAENALMAMKLAAIDTPHKIIRDLIDENTPLTQARLREVEGSEHVEFSLQQKDEVVESNFEYREPKGLEAFFQPMTLGQINEEKVDSVEVMESDNILEKISIDPMEYARSTRTDDAERISSMSEEASSPIEPQAETAAPEPLVEEQQPAQVVEQETVSDATPTEFAQEEPQQEVAVEMPIEESAHEVAESEPLEAAEANSSEEKEPSEEEMPPDEVARLLAEPRD